MFFCNLGATFLVFILLRSYQSPLICELTSFSRFGNPLPFYQCKYHASFSFSSSSMTFITGILELLNILHDLFALFFFSFSAFCFLYLLPFVYFLLHSPPIYKCCVFVLAVSYATQPLSSKFHINYFSVNCFCMFSILLKSLSLHLYVPNLLFGLLNIIIMDI